jgi:hypothetical protein
MFVDSGLAASRRPGMTAERVSATGYSHFFHLKYRYGSAAKTSMRITAIG